MQEFGVSFKQHKIWNSPVGLFTTKSPFFWVYSLASTGSHKHNVIASSMIKYIVIVKFVLFTDILAGFTVNNRVLRLPAIVFIEHDVSTRKLEEGPSFRVETSCSIKTIAGRRRTLLLSLCFSHNYCHLSMDFCPTSSLAMKWHFLAELWIIPY